MNNPRRAGRMFSHRETIGGYVRHTGINDFVSAMHRKQPHKHYCYKCGKGAVEVVCTMDCKRERNQPCEAHR